MTDVFQRFASVARWHGCRHAARRAEPWWGANLVGVVGAAVIGAMLLLMALIGVGVLGK
jgi:hypothetical protein